MILKNQEMDPDLMMLNHEIIHGRNFDLYRESSKWRADLQLASPLAYLRLPTIFICLHVNRRTLWPVPHTCPGQHPNSVVGPLAELVNDELPGAGVVYLDHRGLAVRPRLGHVEDLVVGDHSVLFVGRWGLPDHPEGAGRLWVGRHLGRGGTGH